MRKYSNKIIMLIIVLGILLAPVSPILKNNDGNLAVGVGVNEAEAILVVDAKITVVSKVDIEDKSATITVTITTVKPDEVLSGFREIHILLYPIDKDATFPDDDAYADDNDYFSVPNNVNTFTKEMKFTSLTLGQKYAILVLLTDGNYDPVYDDWFHWTNQDSYNEVKTFITGNLPFTEGTFFLSSGDTGSFVEAAGNVKVGLQFNCGFGGIVDDGSIKGCVAELSYALFEVAAWIARGLASFLDFFVYYSTNSTSYTNEFVTKAFGAIRDIANIFFIIALLYVAIKTILSLNVTNNKKLIGTIVVVALLINFSLFFTQVIIDGTNILAKVFYNQITAVDESDNLIPAGVGGQKSISVGLVDKFNPQKILTAGAGEDAQAYYNTNKGQFIFITLLAMFIVLYAAYVFLMVALLFVGRVVALWLAMIFAPIAFASYTMPFNIPGFGHKDWWDELLKNAFLAPIFIFFLYIIVMFAGFLPSMISYNTTSPDTMQQIMGVVIPFAILMILLMKAKAMAITFSGSIGKGIMSIAGKVGGVAGGAALGAAAVVGGGALRATVGRAGSAIGESKWAKSMASSRFGAVKFLGNKAMDVGKAAGKGSFDIRGAKIAGMGLAGVTGLKLGEAKKGGFEQAKADQIAKRQQRAQELEAGHGEKERKDLNTAESEHQGILGKLAVEIEKLDKTIDKTRQAELDAKNRVITLTKTGDIGEEKKDKDGKVIQTQGKDYAVYQKAKEDQRRASDNLTALKAQKTALRKGEDYHEKIKDENGDPKDIGGDYSKTAVHTNKDGTTRSIKSYEDDLIPEAKGALKALNAQRKFGYAKGMDKWGSKIFNYITSAGMHSGIGANEAAYKIRMDMKLDSGTKTS